MAKDPSKKGVRKIPSTFLDWITETYGEEVAKWYKTTTGKGKAEASRQRIDMSDAVGSTGAYHEGHFQGAKDFDTETGMGGGPTTGRTLRPEAGFINVAHAEQPRIAQRDMRRLGIPLDWLTDFYEAIHESEGNRVIDNLDIQGSMAVDAGMSVEHAAGQTRLRQDLRRQGVQIPGDRYVATDKPAPITQLPKQQAVPPEFDVSRIKDPKTGGVPIAKTRTKRVPKVPRIKQASGAARVSFRDAIGAAYTGMYNTGFGHPGDEDPFGGRTIELDPLFTGATIKLP